jgi:hypothetical protein
MDDDCFLGEIRSGETWKTDETPAVMKPVFSRIIITPNPATAKTSVRIQVFVQDTLTPVE